MIKSIAQIKVISLDVTGTLLAHKYPIAVTYVECMKWAGLADPPSPTEFGKAYKLAYRANCALYPCFGSISGLTARCWWKKTAELALEFCHRRYSDKEIDRFFRRVYQHYGSTEGYSILPDAYEFLEWAKSQKNDDGSNKYVLGVASNTPRRVMETVLPMMNMHNYFSWFICSEDNGFEKPDSRFFKEVLALSQENSFNEVHSGQVLHIGDNLAADYCGAKAAGLQALLLDRSKTPNVTVYQDWLVAPDYYGKCEDDIRRGTISSLLKAKEILQGL